MLKMTTFSPAQPRRAEARVSSSFVLSRPSPCNVPPGDRAVLAARGGRVEKNYASVAGLPAALLGCHFEHPTGIILLSCGRKNKEEDI
jgi:hypothetical protein